MDEITEMTLKRDEMWDVNVSTVGEAEMVLDAFERLRARAGPIAKALMELEHDMGPTYTPDSEDIEFEDGQFEYTYEKTYCGCCEGDKYTVTIPMEYLFDPEWVKQAEAKVEARRLVEEARKEKERLAQIERGRKAQYEQYKKLKEKFEK